jgi:TRAP transporter TAXI family solute receptor
MLKSNFARLLLAVVLVVIVAVAAYVYYDQTRVYTIRIGTSGEGSLSYSFGRAFAKIASRENPRIQIQIVETEGSAENMQLLHEGKLDFAIASNDTPAVPEARVVAFVYPSIFHLIVPTDSPIQNVVDLKGKRVGTPSVGGGSYNSFLTLLKYYDIQPEEFASFQNLSSSKLPEAFLQGELDAQFGSDAIGLERQAKSLSSGRARLVVLDQAAAMRLTLPYIEAVIIPKGAYKANPPVPAEDLQTIGIQTSLLAHRNLEIHLVQEITQMLFDYRLELAEAAPQLADLKSPLESVTLGMAVHEGALAYYNRDQPNFLQENPDYIALLITLVTMGFSAVLTVRSRLSQKQKSRADQYTQEIVTLMGQVQAMNTQKQLDEAEHKLFVMFKQVVDDLGQDQMAESSAESFMLTWNQAIQAVRHRELVFGGAGVHSAAQ